MSQQSELIEVMRENISLLKKAYRREKCISRRLRQTVEEQDDYIEDLERWVEDLKFEMVNPQFSTN